jgi:serine/threonine-protein kinase RsbW
MSEPETCFHFKISSQPQLAEAVCQKIVAAVKQIPSYSDRDIFSINLCLEEALTNAIKHGNGLNPDKFVCIRCIVSNKEFRAQITDEGEGVDPALVPDPTRDENLMKENGRGLLLLCHFMDEVTHSRQGNSLTIVKTSSAQARSTTNTH